MNEKISSMQELAEEVRREDMITPENEEMIEEMLSSIPLTDEINTTVINLIRDRLQAEVATKPDSSQRELSAIVDEFMEERKALLKKGGYESHDHTVNTGNRSGAGTIDMGINALEERTED